jgi:hypothetical protein
MVEVAAFWVDEDDDGRHVSLSAYEPVWVWVFDVLELAGFWVVDERLAVSCCESVWVWVWVWVWVFDAFKLAAVDEPEDGGNRNESVWVWVWFWAWFWVWVWVAGTFKLAAADEPDDGGHRKLADVESRNTRNCDGLFVCSILCV